jgi:indolepyruvate decarboxylase
VLNEINDTPNKKHFIEVHMDANDTPEKLNKVAQAFSNQNS